MQPYPRAPEPLDRVAEPGDLRREVNEREKYSRPQETSLFCQGKGVLLQDLLGPEDGPYPGTE